MARRQWEKKLSWGKEVGVGFEGVKEGPRGKMVLGAKGKWRVNNWFSWTIMSDWRRGVKICLPASID